MQKHEKTLKKKKKKKKPNFFWFRWNLHVEKPFAGLVDSSIISQFIFGEIIVYFLLIDKPHGFSHDFFSWDGFYS